jgi:signal transduction histidine kinase
MRGRSLRTRLALAFVAAVVTANLLFAASAGIVLYLHERREVQQAKAADPKTWEEDDGVVLEPLVKVAMAMAVAAPLTIAGAALLGYWLAARALQPMREAAARARAARAGLGALELPVRGTGDEWDELAIVTNELLGEQRRVVERAKAFSANAAHELRTPLTGLLGELQVTLRRERTADEYRTALRAAEAEASRLTAVINSLLELARAESSQVPGVRQPFELGEAAHLAAERAASWVGQGRRPEVKGAARATGDPYTVGRVLDNLLDNALRHGLGEVVVEVWSSPGKASAAVSDHGNGLSAETRARLFERFNKGASSDGFGLGLSIARALAESQGGGLWLDEGAGRTRFVFELPEA